ncbi:DUF7222 domain-containing protein [Bacillus swezeyi]|uniref:DUF7222 domain-containing protein n=1 Tax=Bacillus swezeyi TaxID=1925020 RepID=UPI001239BABA|nr:hypothetical protein [Bacillus swezeyi]KAA6475743.1 hypothetical protein DX928_06450 [Bacillus swezeyi]
MNKLEKHVMEIIEENGGRKFAADVLTYGCVSVCVPNLVYYADTHKWFDKFYHEIMELVKKFEEMTGEKLHHTGDLKNWYAWFSFEETTRKLYEGGF